MPDGSFYRIDTALLEALLENDVVPVIPPLGCDGEGHTYRLNSDGVAVEVARALRAVKLIYLTPGGGKYSAKSWPWQCTRSTGHRCSACSILCRCSC